MDFHEQYNDNISVDSKPEKNICIAYSADVCFLGHSLMNEVLCELDSENSEHFASNDTPQVADYATRRDVFE